MGILDRVQFKPPLGDPPHGIDITPNHEFRIDWGEGKVAIIPSLTMRDACPCAACVEEFTGKKILDPKSIPADIRPLEIISVGNYAVQVIWSDDHSTGIYTWETLRKISNR
jgi:DUF971 family protein